MTAAQPTEHVEAVSFTLHVRTVSILNSREHWRVRHRRAKAHRSQAALLTMQHVGASPRFPLEVRMTRVSAGELDDDNLSGALKEVRDGVADGLGIKDNDPRVTWARSQRRGKRGEFAVEVELRWPA